MIETAPQSAGDLPPLAKQWADKMQITRLANITGLDHIGIPVVLAVRPLSRSLSVAQGKGMTLAAAKLSAIMEAAETFHAERITSPVFLSNYRDLAQQHNVVDIARLCTPPSTNPDHSKRLFWIEGRQIGTNSPIWVPLQTVHTAYTEDMLAELGSFHNCTAGLAAGMDIWRATSHAILEVIERDAWLLTSVESAERLQARKLNLETVNDDDCRTLIERLSQANISIAAWDTTQDISIPSFRCVVSDTPGSVNFRGMCAAAGFGCHPNRGYALLAALLEAIQTRLTIISGSRDDLLSSLYWEHQSAAATSFSNDLVRPKGTRDFETIPTNSHHFTERFLLDSLSSAGLEQVITVDLSRRDIGISVVRVIIPGMEIYNEVGECNPGKRLQRKLTE